MSIGKSAEAETIAVRAGKGHFRKWHGLAVFIANRDAEDAARVNFRDALQGFAFQKLVDIALVKTRIE
ncbi:hypothetical protein PsB1_0934 [Candidatus Phycosocius spiralis]|uniref:Uncharacterized protein n=1 Tax=Candidatus Phycosocius spiralis TaxID=2815099 RepID=A0ABQ4PUS5_9PROT|nr:hypothetical protein PsB1_0934 [Candidatus Phycosocius spiralis]